MRRSEARRGVVVLCCLGVACRLAAGAASWSGQPYTLTVPEQISGAGQTCSGSVAMTLDHDQPCSLGVSVGEAGDEILSCAGDALATSYKLTGDALLNGDGDWVAANVFLTHSYNVQGTGPADEIKLWVRGAGASDRANNAGTYSAAVILTASW